MTNPIRYSALLVDDSPEILRFCKRSLEAEDIACDFVADGFEALERLRQGNYDIIISDLRMPRMHGHKLMREMQDSRIDTPFFVMTGVTDPRIIRDLLKRGAVDVITKPFSFALMAVRVRHLLETRAARMLVQDDGDPRDTLSKQLAGTSTMLQQQLMEVTKTFEATIADLNRQRDELESGYLGSVRILANLIEQVGQSKRSHAVRVEAAAAAVAESVGYPPKEVLNLKIGALLHEVGAFGMPDSIRQKAPWSLTSEDREYYERYPEVGAMFLSELKDSKPVVQLVECHAENFDGTGFPAKRSGDAIPFGARILRIADGCDTYLMHCGGTHPLDALQTHLLQEKGRLYDPKLVAAASAYFDEQLRTEDDTYVISVRDLHDGLILAENIYDDQGRFLARDGVELTEVLYTRIQRVMPDAEIRVRDVTE